MSEYDDAIIIQIIELMKQASKREMEIIYDFIRTLMKR